MKDDPATRHDWLDRVNQRSNRAHAAALVALVASFVLTRCLGVLVEQLHEADDDYAAAAADANVNATRAELAEHRERRG